jgi:carboxymethylenebutenolidase
MVGFSLGGHIAYLAATGLDLAATAVLYGGWLPTTDIPLSRPEPTLDLTPGIAKHGGRVLVLVGDEDRLIPAEQRRLIAERLSEAGVRHELVVYPGTPHAFFFEEAETFRPGPAEDAWRRVTELLAAELTPEP